MQALIFGLLGVVLGVLTGRLAWPPVLRRIVLAVIAVAGLVAVIAVNAMVAEAFNPALNDNLLLGGGVFLLGLWYFHTSSLQRHA